MIAGISGLAGPAAYAAGSTADQIFSEIERAVIERYYRRVVGSGEATGHAGGGGDAKASGKGRGKHKSKGKGRKGLPPGLAKRDSLPPGLARKQQLPPGLRKEPLPADLERQLPPVQPGLERVLVEGRAVLIERATNRVLDVLEDVIAGRY